jgi:integrase
MMARKRAVHRSRGQIVDRGNGRFLLRVYLGRDAEGRRLYESETFAGTMTDARARLGAMQATRDTNTGIKPNDYTVASFWPQHLADLRDLAPNTREQYEDRFRLDISPRLGKILLRDLEPSEVSRWITWMLEERGVGSRTVRYSYTLLHGMYETALKWSLVSRNPVQAKLPAKAGDSEAAHEEMQVFTPAQTVAFLDAADMDPLRPLWFTLLYAGLRPQEAFALTWADFDGRRLTVSKALVRCRDKKTSKLAWRVGPTKTKKGRRTVSLPGEAAAALKQHQIKTGGIGTALVFKTESGGYLDIANVRKAWIRACKRAKVPVIRLYDARHTNATTMLTGGVPLKVASERLGHASVQITADIYSHVLPETDESAADEISAVLNKARRA